MYDSSQPKISVEYANQFWRKYKDDRKFMHFYILEGHEGVGELIKSVD